MKILEDLNLEFREAIYMNGPGQWLWPKEDSMCWDHFNVKEKLYYSSKNKNSYHLPHDIMPLLPENRRNLILQAGGNAGLYPAIYSEFFRQVITFEPHDRWFTCLSVNAPQANIFKLRVAIGNNNEPVKMITPGGNMGGMYVTSGGIIPKITIDSLGLSPDLIHLDIEGAEYSALQGAMETIKRSKPVIVVEWDRSTMSEFGYSPEEFDNFFTSNNYVLQKSWDRDRAYVYKDNYIEELNV